jgi:hypothetical protein
MGRVEVLVHAVEAGQAELRIWWPDHLTADMTEERNAFIRMAQAEHDAAIE